jgi:ribosomal protein S6
MKLYEINLLCKDEESFARLGDAVKKLTKIKKEQSLGEKRLAYPIKKQKTGFLGSFWIETDHKTLTKLKEELKQETDLLRYLILSKLDWQMEETSVSQKLEERARAAAPKKAVKRPIQIEKTAKPKPKPAEPKKEKVTKKPKKTEEKPVKAERKEDAEKRLKVLDKKLEEILKE